MTRAVRAPGSTLKPLLYGLAFDDGFLDPRSIVTDAPLRISGYAPATFAPAHLGELSAADALQLSLNVPAVAVLDRESVGEGTSWTVRVDLGGPRDVKTKKKNTKQE